jgi:hypothetical protein
VLELAILLIIIVVFIGIVIYDRRTPARPMSRKSAQQGFVPGASARWIGAAVVSAVMVLLGLMELANLIPDSTTGRHARLFATLKDIFGQYTIAVIFLVMGAATGYWAYRVWKERSKTT